MGTSQGRILTIQTGSEYYVALQQSGTRLVQTLFYKGIRLADANKFALYTDAHVHDYWTVQGSCAQEKHYLLADSQFLEAIRGNGLVNQSNHSPRSPQLFQIYFCLTFPSIFLSTWALIIMETYDYGT